MKFPLRNWCIAAVDPGKAPTICVLWDRGESVKWYDHEHTSGWRPEERKAKTKARTQPNADKIRVILEYHNPDLIVVENVWVRPGQGIVSSARLVNCRALCEGIAVGMGKSLLSLFPQSWMRHHGLITKEKSYHRTFAALLAPQHSWAFVRVKDHDRADSLLMAHTGLAFLDKLYERNVRRGAPLDHVPKFISVR